MGQPSMSADVAAVYDAFPTLERDVLLQLRALIFEIAAKLPDVGPIEETLKWGQPSYHTAQSKSGTPIRLGRAKTGGLAIFTHCQTSVMANFRHVMGDTFQFDGNRAVYLSADAPLDREKLEILIRNALCYHLRGRAKA